MKFNVGTLLNWTERSDFQPFNTYGSVEKIENGKVKILDLDELRVYSFTMDEIIDYKMRPATQKEVNNFIKEKIHFIDEKIKSIKEKAEKSVSECEKDIKKYKDFLK